MRKKVLFIDHDPGRSGSTVSLEYLVKAFTEADFQVSVLSPKREREAGLLRSAGAAIIGFDRWHLSTLAVNFHFTNKTSPFSWKGLTTNIKECLKFLVGILIVARAIVKTKADLVYANEYVVVQASIAARFCRVPAVMHVRSPLLEGVLGLRRYLATRLILGFNDKVFAITRREADQLHPRPGEIDRIKVVGEFFPPSTNILTSGVRARAILELPKAEKIVAMLGGVQIIKGTLEFLLAAQLVLSTRNDVVFVVAGKDWGDTSTDERAYSNDCMRLTRTSPLCGAVKMLGEIDDSLALVASANIVVSPSQETHFSRPVIEAWGFGIPVVATKTEHMMDLIADGVNGLLVDIQDQEGMAKSILRLLEDEDLCQRIGNAGKMKVHAEFDAETNTNAIIQACNSLICV